MEPHLLAVSISVTPLAKWLPAARTDSFMLKYMISLPPPPQRSDRITGWGLGGKRGVEESMLLCKQNYANLRARESKEDTAFWGPTPSSC